MATGLQIIALLASNVAKVESREGGSKGVVIVIHNHVRNGDYFQSQMTSVRDKPNQGTALVLRVPVEFYDFVDRMVTICANKLNIRHES